MPDKKWQPGIFSTRQRRDAPVSSATRPPANAASPTGASARTLWRAPSILILTLCALLATACDRGSHPANIGKPAPQFTLADGSQTVDLARLRGRIVVLNFWATWCAPCIDELPSLMELQRRFPRIVVLAISQDADPAAYRQFLLDYRIGFLTLRDPSMRIQTLYGTVKIPETYVIDRNGILRRKFVSAQDWTSPEILDYLNKLQPLP